MKKRWTAFFLAFLLGLGLTACGKTPGPDTNTDAPPSAADSAEDTRQQTSAPFSADYWTAVRHESYDAMNDCMKTSAMPTEAWWADLYLNEDGTAQFRDVLGSYYNTSLLDGNWWLGADSTLRLTGTMNTGEPLTLDGSKAPILWRSRPLTEIPSTLPRQSGRAPAERWGSRTSTERGA